MQKFKIKFPLCSPGLQFSCLWSTCSTSCGSEDVALQCKNVYKSTNNPVPQMEREGYCIFQISGQCRRCILSVSLHIYGNIYTFVGEWNPTMRSSTWQFVANAYFWGGKLRISKCQCIDFVCSLIQETNFQSTSSWGIWVFFFSPERFHEDLTATFQNPRGSYWKARKGLWQWWQNA